MADDCHLAGARLRLQLEADCPAAEGVWHLGCLRHLAFPSRLEEDHQEVAGVYLQAEAMIHWHQAEAADVPLAVGQLLAAQVCLLVSQQIVEEGRAVAASVLYFLVANPRPSALVLVAAWQVVGHDLGQVSQLAAAGLEGALVIQ